MPFSSSIVDVIHYTVSLTRGRRDLNLNFDIFKGHILGRHSNSMSQGAGSREQGIMTSPILLSVDKHWKPSSTHAGHEHTNSIYDRPVKHYPHNPDWDRRTHSDWLREADYTCVGKGRYVEAPQVKYLIKKLGRL